MPAMAYLLWQVRTAEERKKALEDAAGGARNKVSALPSVQPPKKLNAKQMARTGAS